MKRLLPLSLLLFATQANCQTLLLDGGSSTLFHGSGGQATMFLPNSTMRAGVGYRDGRFLVGASDTFLMHGFKMTVGDETLGFSFDGVGLGLALKGISINRTWKTDCQKPKPTSRLGPVGYLGKCRESATTVTAFVGGTSDSGFFAPYISAARESHIGTGVLVQHNFGHLVLSSLDVLEGGKYSLAQGASYELKRIKLSAAGGLLNNQKFFTGIAVIQPIRATTLYASHQDYFIPFAAQSNSVGANLVFGRFTAVAGLNESKSLGRKVKGENFGVGVRVGWVQEQSTYYKSDGSRLLVHAITETMRRWTFQQAINQMVGRNSYSFGGGYTSNKFSISLTHSMQFIIGRGYQRVTGVNLSFRIRDSVVNAQTVTDPFGKTQYSAWAESYVQTGLQIAGHETRHSGGKYLITGKCVLPDDSPVEGCAVVINKEIVYSNSRGEFSLHVKKRVAVVTTPVADFAAPGEFVCVNCPVDATAGETITVTVRRK